MRPRIYTYKITFIDTPYYYYGVHKERYFNEYYMGTPVTHKWCWEFYEPDKQILEFFEFSDEGWVKAQEIEKQLIKPFFNTDKWCLNESCGGKMSLETRRKNGLKLKKNGIGIFSQTPEERLKNSIKGGLKTKENGIGIFSQTPEERSELGRKNALKTKENGTGLFSQTPEEWSENSRKIGLRHKENGTGLFSLTDEQKSELGRRNGLQHKENGTSIFSFTPEQRSELGRKTCTQKWECLETGFTTNPGNLTHYQKKRGIDTSKRKRIS
jgi:hypothetical protein